MNVILNAPNGDNAEFTLIGLGDRQHHDDGLGWEVAERLNREDVPSAEIIESYGDSQELLQILKDKNCVILIDTFSSGAQPGSIFRYDISDTNLLSELTKSSTHSYSVAEAIATARDMGVLPQKLIVYGVEGKNFTGGVGLSSEVTKAIGHVITCVHQDRKRIKSDMQPVHA